MTTEGAFRLKPAAWLAAWPAAWRRTALVVAVAWVGLIGLFHDDWTAMAGQWWGSSTYTHILIVPAIVAWLVGARSGQLALLTPRAWWPGLIPFAAAAMLWLLGTMAGLSLASQAGAVAMLVAAAITLLGPKASAGLAFPLAYLAFLVPFGDELVPALQMITAKLTIAFVGLSGVPAQIDGVFIETPAGLFEVAEACSGVKFLIAMVAFGVLVANVCFNSWSRRAIFLVLAMVLSILANSVRAWGTIFLAQYVGADQATGIDHLIYGWIFFAVVMAVTLAIAWRFFDRAAVDPMIDAGGIERSGILSGWERYSIPTSFALAAFFALALLAMVWASAADRLRASLSDRIALPEVAGWRQVPYAPAVPWEPRASGADHRLLGRYRDAQGRQVDVFIALYALQDENREAGGFGEGALRPGSGWAWLSPGATVADAKADRLLGAGRHLRLAETTYRTGQVTTGSNLQLKLANIADRLALRARPTTLLILSSEDRDPGASLGAFRASVGPLGPWMDRVTQTR